MLFIDYVFMNSFMFLKGQFTRDLSENPPSLFLCFLRLFWVLKHISVAQFFHFSCFCSALSDLALTPPIKEGKKQTTSHPLLPDKNKQNRLLTIRSGIQDPGTWKIYTMSGNQRGNTFFILAL